MKKTIDDLAIFGGARMFATPKPTSNLVRPDFDTFLAYSRTIFEQHQYTDNGVLVQQLEMRLATFHHTKHCVAFCSGFWAMALAIKALALPGKSEIVMPSFTYRRMADIAAWTKLKPHFCDVEAATLANSAKTVLPCINENTALIMGVHPIVNSCDIDGLTDLANTSGVPLLFDSVESVYEYSAGRKIGGFGSAEIFSLGASKLVNGFEGGYITTNDAQLAERLSQMRNYGLGQDDEVVTADGLNAKLNEVHAAMALAGLDELEDQVLRNRERYMTYKRLMSSLKGLRLFEFDETQKPGYKNIVIEVLDDWPLTRAQTVSILNAEMILARAYYTPPLHRKRMAYPHVEVTLPVTDELAERFILPPCGHLVSNDDIAEIVGILDFISTNAVQIKSRLQQQAMQSQ